MPANDGSSKIGSGPGSSGAGQPSNPTRIGARAARIRSDIASTIAARTSPVLRSRAMTYRGLAVSTLLLTSLTACPQPEPAEWQEVFSDLDGALFSIWGTGPDDVWVVGADAGAGPAVLHYDGSAWTSLDSGQSANLWWV